MHRRKGKKEEIMHSRIFQISKEPVTEENRFEEDRYFDGFVGRIADYVDEIGYPETEYDDLKAMLGDAVEFVTRDSFRIVDKKKWFEKKHERFVFYAKKLSESSLEDFCSQKLDMDVFNVEMEYEDKYNTYIDDGGEWFGTVPLDEFIRGSDKTETEVWHLGAVFDYHY